MELSAFGEYSFHEMSESSKPSSASNNNPDNDINLMTDSGQSSDSRSDSDSDSNEEAVGGIKHSGSVAPPAGTRFMSTIVSLTSSALDIQHADNADEAEPSQISGAKSPPVPVPKSGRGNNHRRSDSNGFHEGLPGSATVQRHISGDNSNGRNLQTLDFAGAGLATTPMAQSPPVIVDAPRHDALKKSKPSKGNASSPLRPVQPVPRRRSSSELQDGVEMISP